MPQPTFRRKPHHHKCEIFIHNVTSGIYTSASTEGIAATETGKSVRLREFQIPEAFWYNIPMDIELDKDGIPLDPKVLEGREFEHFKGKRYRLVEFAIDSETLEPLVVYRQLYGEHRLWVRPAKMFFEHVERDGYTGPRFRVVEEAE